MQFKCTLPKSCVVLLVFALALAATACSTVSSTKPSVVIASPPHGSQYHEGEDVAVQSTATDAAGITRVDLIVNGAVVRSDPSPQPQASFTLIQTWKAVPGTHTITVLAYNTKGVASDPAVISISASASSAPAPTATAPSIPPLSRATATFAVPPTAVPPTAVPPTTAPPSGACTNNATFVADVTMSDGTLLAPSQTFNKIWRVRNSGTCAWGSGYQLVYVTGESLATNNAIAVPQTAAGANADLLIAMTAPAGLGVHTTQWRLKSASGALFGPTLSVNINVVSTSAPPAQPPATSGCTGTPNIESFSASPSTINGGQSSTLNWGAVTGADSVEVDNGIGGVPAPGNASVTPAKTTTYTITAHCGANVATKQATITVIVLAPPVQAFPDLYVSEFTLTPNPPDHAAVTTVRIGIYNKGNAAVTKPFVVEWWAGSGYVTGPAKTWTINSLPAKGGQILTYSAPSHTWASAYPINNKITTRVKVDSGGAITESDKSNNVYDVEIQVK